MGARAVGLCAWTGRGKIRWLQSVVYLLLLFLVHAYIFSCPSEHLRVEAYTTSFFNDFYLTLNWNVLKSEICWWNAKAFSLSSVRLTRESQEFCMYFYILQSLLGRFCYFWTEPGLLFSISNLSNTHRELIIVKQQILKNTRLLGPFVLHSRPYYFLNTSIINALKGKNTTKRVPEDNWRLQEPFQKTLIQSK